jgi:thiamine biosynthesis lipoprotein
MKRVLLLGILTAVLTVAVVCYNRRPVADSHITGHAMGTQWTLAWRGDTPPDLVKHVAAVLEHWQQVMSQWRSDSDLSRFNRGEPATEDLQRVIRLAENMREASDGAFDHEILQEVHAAGYGPPGSGIDLSGIGKGFAVDRVAERLRELGVREFIFELGGDLVAGGGDWTVGIESPVPGKRSLIRNVTLSKRALATSGNTYQASHIIDPRTGEPVSRAPMTVTVIASDCATADAWATALFVLGPGYRDIPKKVEVTWNEVVAPSAKER